MKLSYYLISLTFLVVFPSCENTNNTEDSKEDSVVYEQKSFEGRIDLSNKNKEYEIVSDELNLAKKSKELELVLVGEVLPAKSGEHTLQATDLYLSGNTLFVSYNMAGAKKMGAVTSIDVKHGSDPEITSEIIYSNRDVNAIHFSSDYVYITGSWEQESLSYLTRIKTKSKKC